MNRPGDVGGAPPARQPAGGRPRQDLEAAATAEGALLVDGGRTGIRLARVERGLLTPIGSGGGLPLIAPAGGPAAVTETIAVAAEAAGFVPGTALELVAGVTGLFEVMDRAPELAARLAARLDVPRCTVTSDVVTSHLGALAGQAGVVAAVGTGTVVLALAPDGRWAKVDGWGYLLGDGGSGFHVGQRGLVAALEHHDGRGGSAPLAVAAAERYGSLDELTGRVYAAQNPVALIASFAPDVAVAARAGDRTARAIWADAADAVVRAIVGAADAIFPTGVPTQVSWAGSMLDVADLLRGPVVTALTQARPELEVVAPRGGALDGAAALLDPAVASRAADLLHVHVTWSSRGRPAAP